MDDELDGALGSSLRRRAGSFPSDSHFGGAHSRQSGAQGVSPGSATHDVQPGENCEPSDVIDVSERKWDDGLGSASVEAGSAGDAPAETASPFECNICFDLPRDPVVTQCGHLYCWPCLFRWMNVGPSSGAARHPTAPTLCPVCKSVVQKSTVIPIYGRNSSENKDPRESPVEDVPPRPLGQRSEAPQVEARPAGINFPPYFGVPNGRFSAHENAYGSFSFTAFGLFPQIFGFYMNYPPGGAGMNVNHQPGPGPSIGSVRPNHRDARHPGQSHGPALTPEQQSQEFLSRILLISALFVIFFLLFC
ncbi:E3 ubiquitin-protein ligase [Porphyridium purpureum]|uniref:RING-type E3 ubiquitin transferase n=1 Tax=Porphyridium purpureum TaxID=35688 RepID=A0A5J4YRT6_PORPP|nr:E3 ubiquitin-protein ligase [Porphyridium purpureum]|eukprot:POR1949..scf229_5